MESRPNRRLAAMLAADVAGYSRLVGEDEEGTVAALRALRSEVIEPLIAEHGGRIANTAGDSFLIEFRSAVDAVRAAIRIQESLANRNAAAAQDRAIMLRIGLNVGDVVSDGDDILGDGVNVAARLEALAEPGGIVASHAVINYARGNVAAGFVPMGAQRVKNIAEPVEAFRVEPGGSNARAKPSRKPLPLTRIATVLLVLVLAMAGAVWLKPWEHRQARASAERMAYPLPDEPSIAVLPFTDFSGDENNAIMVDGVTEDLITDLSRISGLFVIAGNTSLAYRDEEIGIARFAEELGVRFVVDGSLRRSDADLRINIRLTDTANGRLLWAERYDGAINDLFDVQSTIALAIADALDLSVAEQERIQIEKPETQKIEAREAFQRGWELYARFNERDNLAAVAHFEQAVALDPDYGRAWAALALVHVRPHIFYHWNAFFGDDGQMHIGRFYENLRQASKHETSLLHVVRAITRLNLRDWVSVGDKSRGTEDARQEAAKAIAMQPSDPEAHLTMGWALIAGGEPQEGLSFVEAAMRLDPKHPSHYVLFQAAAHFAMDDLETAAIVLLDELERKPQAKELMPFAASILALSGDRRAGRDMVDLWQTGQNAGALDEQVHEYYFILRWTGEHRFLNQKLMDGLRLAALPPGTTVAGLSAELSRGDARQQRAAARALGLFGPQASEAVPELIDALNSSSAFVRKEVAITLGRIGAAAAPALPALEAEAGASLSSRFAARAAEQIREDLSD